MKNLYVLFLLFVAVAVNGQYIWNPKADLPYAGYCQSSFVIGDTAYVGLGSIDYFPATYTDEFYKYSPVEDVWTPVATFPNGGLYGATGFSVNGKGYICCGFNEASQCTQEVWEYDPVTDTWTQKGDFPGQARYHAASFVIDSMAYIVGGSYNNGYDYLNDLWRYDPVDDQWVWISDMPIEHSNTPSTVVLNGKGYVLCIQYDTYTALNQCLEYDPNINTWIYLPDLPEVIRAGTSAFIIDDQIVLGLGADPETKDTYSSFWAFNPLFPDWYSVTGLPPTAKSRCAAISFTIDNVGYITGGLSEPCEYGGEILNDTWCFKRYLGTEESDHSDIVIYPNPTTGIVYLRFNASEGSDILFRAFDLSGRCVFSAHLTNGQGPAPLDLSHLAQGLYSCEVLHGESLLFREKIVVRK